MSLVRANLLLRRSAVRALGRSSFVTSQTRVAWMRPGIVAGSMRSYSTPTSSNNKDDNFINPEEVFGKDSLTNVADSVGEGVKESAEVVEAVATESSDAAADYMLSGEPYFTTRFAMDSLEFIQNTTGMPWWLTIASFTVLLRLTLTPLNFRTMRMSGKLQKIKHLVEPLSQRMREPGMSKEKRAEMQMKLMQTYKDHGVNPVLTMAVPLLQIPIFITMFGALRRLVIALPDQLGDGGLLWFTDLCAKDPMMRLPIINACLIAVAYELNVDGTNPQSELMTWFIRGFSVLTIFLTSHFPQALHVYWISTSAFTILFGFFARHPSVRKSLGLPLHHSRFGNFSPFRQRVEQPKVEFKKPSTVVEPQTSAAIKATSTVTKPKSSSKINKSIKSSKSRKRSHRKKK